MNKEVNVMKKTLLLVCYYINLLLLGLFSFTIIAALFKFQPYLDFFFFNETFMNIRMLLAIPVFVLWINNLVVWPKHVKNIGRFLLLFFLIGIYSPFYFQKILKNNWQ